MQAEVRKACPHVYFLNLAVDYFCFWMTSAAIQVAFLSSDVSPWNVHTEAKYVFEMKI